MSDRLQELQRQRALAAQQLEQLEREIARQSAPPPTGEPANPPVTAPDPSKPAAMPDALAATTDAEAERLIAEYQEGVRPVKEQVRLGCFLYFFGAFALIGLGLAAFYYVRHH